MAKETSRMRRVSELIQHELAQILQREASDLGLNLLATVTGVNVSPDFSHAKVFISVLEDDKVTEVIKKLNEAAKDLRFVLAQRIKLRIVPDLRFVYDDSTHRGAHISSLIDQALKK